MATVDTYELVDAVSSLYQRTGLFEACLKHEPKKAPTGPAGGFIAATYADRWIPVAQRSGLQKTGMLLALKGRIYRPFIAQPEDDIDPDMLARVDAIHREFNANLTLGFDRGTYGIELDLLGDFTTGVSTVLGYINMDGTIFRVADTAIPIFVPTYYPQIAG